MTFLQARQEFQIRLYQLACSEWEKEILAAFPNLKLFKTGACWELLQFLQQLDCEGQMKLAHALLKRNFASATQALGETFSKEDEQLCARRDDFFRIRGLYQFVKRLETEGQVEKASNVFQRFRNDAIKILGEFYCEDEKSLRSRLDVSFRLVAPTFDEQLATRKLAGEPIKFASASKLRKAMIAKFKRTFGSQCIGPKFLVEEDEPQFQMRFCGWILTTDFSFGGSEGMIEYSHTISSEDTIESGSEKGSYRTYAIVGQNISFCSWLGITGATQWEYLAACDIEPVCETVLRLCGHFFEAVPQLLKGLEFERIAEN